MQKNDEKNKNLSRFYCKSKIKCFVMSYKQIILLVHN